MLKLNRVVLCMVVGLLLAQTSFADPNDPNMLGWWPLSDGVGDVAMDVSENANDGVISGENGGWVEDADFGSVLHFGGDVNGLSVYAGEIPQMTLENGFTWAFWANQDEALAGNNHIVLGNRYSADGTDFAPRQFTKFTPTKFEWHADGGDAGNLSYSEPMVGGEWTHHALIKDANVVTYYRDGGKDAQGLITLGFDVPMPLYFGGDGNGRAGENWMGMMSDVRLFTETLSIVQLADVVPVVLADFENEPNDPNLPVEWEVVTNETTGPTVVVDPMDPNNQVLELVSPGNQDYALPLVVDPNGHLVLSVKMAYDGSLEGVNNDFAISVGDGAGAAWGNQYAIIRMGQGTSLDVRNGDAYESMIDETVGMTWYEIVMDIDGAAKTYDVYVNGELLTDDAAFRSQDPDGIQSVRIRSGGAGTFVGYLDDIIIGGPVPELPEPEPEPEPEPVVE